MLLWQWQLVTICVLLRQPTLALSLGRQDAITREDEEALVIFPSLQFGSVLSTGLIHNRQTDMIRVTVVEAAVDNLRAYARQPARGPSKGEGVVVVGPFWVPCWPRPYAAPP